MELVEKVIKKEKKLFLVYNKMKLSRIICTYMNKERAKLTLNEHARIAYIWLTDNEVLPLIFSSNSHLMI